jgi:hypothetical protein
VAEVFVISLGDAVAGPGTVVIENIHTVLTGTAVFGARRPEDVTGSTVLPGIRAVHYGTGRRFRLSYYSSIFCFDIN